MSRAQQVCEQLRSLCMDMRCMHVNQSSCPIQIDSLWEVRMQSALEMQAW